MITSQHAADGSSRSPRLEVFQSTWAMVDLPNPSHPWDLQDAVAWMRDQGFGGALQWVADADADFPVVAQIRRSGLLVGVGISVYEETAVVPVARRAQDLGVSFVNAHLHDAFASDAQAVARLDALYEGCDAIGMPLFVETHRGTVTQDLLRTIAYARQVSRMRFTLDASHYVVAGEVTQPDAAPRFNEALSEIIVRSASIHARVSNGEQVQVDIGDGSGPLVSPYIGWWTSAYQHWLKAAAPGDFFPFVCELGPRPYAITVPSGSPFPTGAELSDRRAQALVFKHIAERIRD